MYIFLLNGIADFFTKIRIKPEASCRRSISGRLTAGTGRQDLSDILLLTRSRSGTTVFRFTAMIWKAPDGPEKNKHR